MTIQILDIVSSNKFNAEQEKATGTDGVIIKAGQGSAVYEYKSFVSQCKSAGLLWGLYWLPDARYSPEKCKAAIKAEFPTGDFGPLGIWLDCEKPLWTMIDAIYRHLPYAYYKPIESVAQMIIETYGKKPGIYTGPGAWNLIFSAAPQAVKEWFATMPLWTAQYKTSKPDLYGAWKSWTLWQYQEGPDYSVFNGTEEEFKAFAPSQMTDQKPQSSDQQLSVVKVYPNRIIAEYNDEKIAYRLEGKA